MGISTRKKHWVKYNMGIDFVQIPDSLHTLFMYFSFSAIAYSLENVRVSLPASFAVMAYELKNVRDS